MGEKLHLARDPIPVSKQTALTVTRLALENHVPQAFIVDKAVEILEQVRDLRTGPKATLKSPTGEEVHIDLSLFKQQT